MTSPKDTDWTRVEAYGPANAGMGVVIGRSASLRMVHAFDLVSGVLTRVERGGASAPALRAVALARRHMASAMAVDDVLGLLLEADEELPLTPMVEDLCRAMAAARPAAGFPRLRVDPGVRGARGGPLTLWLVAAALVQMVDGICPRRRVAVRIEHAHGRLSIIVAGMAGSPRAWARDDLGGPADDPADLLGDIAAHLSARILRVSTRRCVGVGLIVPTRRGDGRP